MPRKPSAAPRSRGARPVHKAVAAASVSRTPDTGPPQTALPFEAVPGATLWQAPMKMAAVWSEFAGQLQRAGQQAWQGLQHDAEVATEEAPRSGTPQQTIGLPMEFAAEQAVRWTQLSTQVTTSLLDAQTSWFKDLEAACSQWMGPWLARNGRIAFASAQELVEPPADAGPAQIWWTAQRLWSESTRVWLNAISHDLQSESPAAH